MKHPALRSLAAWLNPWLIRVVTSTRWRRRARWLRALRRRLARRPRRVVLYWRVDDPGSWLLVQVLPAFARHFGLEVEPRVLFYLDEHLSAESDRAQRAPVDALRLAEQYQLHFPRNWQAPDTDAAFRASCILLRHEQDPAFWQWADQLCRHVWHGERDAIERIASEQGAVDADAARLELEARRDTLADQGLCLPATVHYEGEPYCGLERLDHLALRLREEDPVCPRAPQYYGAAKHARLAGPRQAGQGRSLELFFSFHSPYARIALTRAFRLADYYGLELVLRPILPTTLTGIGRRGQLQDAAREAHLNGVPFGRVREPVSAAIEACMALWPFAEKEGRVRAWFLAASTAIWSRGRNLACERGLRATCVETGLDWNRARRWRDDDGWRERAEANRSDLRPYGSHDLPVFRLEGRLVPGQDRFGILEHLICESAGASRG